MASLEGHPMLPLLARTHILHPLMFYCPPRQRRLRLGPGGSYPLDKEEQELEREAEEQVAAHLAEGEAAAGATEAAVPSSSGAPGSSSMAAATTATTGGVPAASSGGAAAAVAARQSSKAAVAAAAAAAARRGKATAAAVAVRGRGGRKAAVPVRRTGGGLELLTSAGRPKFYHSRTCVAMTRDELLGGPEGGGMGPNSDSEGDAAEWQVGAAAAWASGAGRGDSRASNACAELLAAPWLPAVTG
jgi:hypothetical protein